MKGVYKEIRLTDDALTNIHIMTPYLDEMGRLAVSSMMMGLIWGQEMEKNQKNVAVKEMVLME